MKTNKTVPFLMLFCLSAMATSCAFKTAGRASGPGSASAGLNGPVATDEEWTETLLSVPGAKLNVKSMRAEVQNRRKELFRVPELEEIRSDYSGSYTLYRIKNAGAVLENAEGVVFIQPKVFIYGTAQGGNVLQLASDDKKTLSLTFPVAFVDGLRATLPSNEGTHAVALPESLRIPDLAKLKEDLQQQLGQEPRLMPLTTCPRQMSLLHIKGSETTRLPVVPTVSIRNRCPVDEFFTVTVRSSTQEIYDLVQNGISDGLGVQLQADFQVQFREPVALYALQLDPSVIYQALRRRFVEAPFGQSGDPMVYFSFQVVPLLQDSLKTSVEQIGVTGGWVPYFEGVQLLLDVFFDRVDSDGGCQAPNRCFRLKPELSVRMDEPVELQWIEQNVLASSRIIPTVTFVKGLAESYPLRISSERSLPTLGVVPTVEACLSLKGNMPGCDGFSCEKFPDNVYCRNGRTRSPIHHFQVFPGAKIRLSFDRITEWGFELPAPREDTTADQRKGVIRCADSQPIPGACEEYEEFCPVDRIPFCKNQKDECEQEHKLYEDQCRTERVTDRSCGFLGLGHCQEVLKQNTVTCEKVESGTECLKWKTTCAGETEMICPKTDRRCKKPAIVCNQWTTEFYSKYTYSEPWVRPRTIDLSRGQTIEQLWDGLDIEFSWLKEDGKTWGSVTCPLKAFPNRIEGYSITVSLDNQGDTDCQPFNTWNTQAGRWPQIAIINHIGYERSYLCGTLEWTRSITADPGVKERVMDRLSYRCPEKAQVGASDKPVVNTYQPIVDLEGTVSILGRSMDTVSSMVRP
jgi:hypothetical protein